MLDDEKLMAADHQAEQEAEEERTSNSGFPRSARKRFPLI